MEECNLIDIMNNYFINDYFVHIKGFTLIALCIVKTLPKECDLCDCKDSLASDVFL